MAVASSCREISLNGEPIPVWSKTITEYDVMQKFPQLMKRFETGPDCLTIPERFDLQLLADTKSKEHSSTDQQHRVSILSDKVSLVAGGNIAEVSCDAIVNAANASLLTGKGVNGAVHSRAGPDLQEECSKIGGCEVGVAKLTKGYNLPCSHVIHTVGPEESTTDRAELLRKCYSNSLDVCVANSVRSVAFPCISTGQFRYPHLEAGDIALTTVQQWLLADDHHDNIDRVIFVTRKLNDEEIYSTLMRCMFPVTN